MKNWMLVMAVAGVAMAGCSDESEEFPQECEEMIEMFKEMGKDAPADQQLAYEKTIEGIRDSWKHLDKQEREQSKQECVEFKAHFEESGTNPWDTNPNSSQ